MAKEKTREEKATIMAAWFTGATTIAAALIVGFFTLQSRSDSDREEAKDVDHPQQVIVSDTADSGVQSDADSSIDLSGDSTSEDQSELSP